MITLLYASILGLLSVLLANQVLYVRLRGDKEESWRADSVLRVQANFVENVPLALIILYLFETVSFANYIVHIFGIALVIFRLLHACGLGNNQAANSRTLTAAQGTFLLISIMSVAGIYLFFSS